jgi:hypothetical protein
MPVTPDLLAFYDVDTKLNRYCILRCLWITDEDLSGAFHLNSDLSNMDGYAKMKKDLVEIREIAKSSEAEKTRCKTVIDFVGAHSTCPAISLAAADRARSPLSCCRVLLQST